MTFGSAMGFSDILSIMGGNFDQKAIESTYEFHYQDEDDFKNWDSHQKKILAQKTENFENYVKRNWKESSSWNGVIRQYGDINIFGYGGNSNPVRYLFQVNFAPKRIIFNVLKRFVNNHDDYESILQTYRSKGVPSFEIDASNSVDEPEEESVIPAYAIRFPWLESEIDNRMDGQIALTPEQKDFFRRLQKEEFPCLIESGPGGGKTTLLTYALAGLVHQSKTLYQNRPLLVMYNPKLAADAHVLVKDVLVQSYGVEPGLANRWAMESVKTFAQLVDEVLMYPEEPSREDETEGKNPVVLDYEHFCEWWTSREADWLASYTHFRELVLGTLAWCEFPKWRAELTVDALKNLPLAKRRLKEGDPYSDHELETLVKITKKYITESDFESRFAVKVAKALDYLERGVENYTKYGFVLCDEAQDLTYNEVMFLLYLGVDSSMSKKSRSYPFLFARDILQSVVPSGHAENTIDIALDAFSKRINVAPVRVKKIDQKLNFRSTKAIVKVCDAAREMIEHSDPTTCFREEEGDQVKALVHVISDDPARFHGMFAGQLIVPFRGISKAQYLEENQVLKSVWESKFDPGTVLSDGNNDILSVDESKGREFGTVIAYGFGKMLRSGVSDYDKYELNVVLSRPRDDLFIIENTDDDLIWLETKIGTLERKSSVEVSEKAMIDNLRDRVRYAIEDENKQDFQSIILQLEQLYSGVGANLRDYASTWLSILNCETVVDWTSFEKMANGAERQKSIRFMWNKRDYSNLQWLKVKENDAPEDKVKILLGKFYMSPDHVEIVLDVLLQITTESDSRSLIDTFREGLSDLYREISTPRGKILSESSWDAWKEVGDCLDDRSIGRRFEACCARLRSSKDLLSCKKYVEDGSQGSVDSERILMEIFVWEKLGFVNTPSKIVNKIYSSINWRDESELSDLRSRLLDQDDELVKIFLSDEQISMDRSSEFGLFLQLRYNEIRIKDLLNYTHDLVGGKV